MRKIESRLMLLAVSLLTFGAGAGAQTSNEFSGSLASILGNMPGCGCRRNGFRRQGLDVRHDIFRLFEFRNDSFCRP